MNSPTISGSAQQIGLIRRNQGFARYLYLQRTFQTSLVDQLALP